MNNIKKMLLAVVVIVAAVVLVGLAGQTDQDEYIEVNSTPKTRMPFYYE